ncbi:MAG: DUF2339 domain-containing protein, partial [Pseudomonadota bacterium]|nr:DUF2339 domain-containing protein [Pseudomonadota bacterium]
APVARVSRSAADLERAIGGRWSVIIGGLAVAFGAVLLVRYTIEAGLLGPGTRVTLGALFSAALFAGGEWLRRRDTRLHLAAIPQADIPGILTGAGAVGAFATVYSAYALYGFIGAGPAFVALTLVGLASLALSAVHGPKLAALGVVGAYATPLLVATQTPSPLALAAHVLVVTASVLTMARLRDWLWLALCAVAGGGGWTVFAATLGETRLAAAGPGIASTTIGIAGLILVLGLAVIFTAGFAWQRAERPSPLQDRPIDPNAMLAFGVLATAFLVQAAANAQLPLLPTGLVAGLVVMAVSGYWPSMAPAAMAATVIVLAGIAAIDLEALILPGLTPPEQIRQGLVPPDTTTYLMKAMALGVPVGSVAVWAAWRYGAGAKSAAGWLATAAASIGILALVLAYLRIAPFETRLVFGLAGLLLGLLFAALTESFIRLDPEDNKAPAPAALAVAAVAGLCFAIGVSLDAGWMPLAFALASLGIAWIFTSRPVAVLPVLSAVAALAAAITIFASVPFDAESIGTVPLFNKLILLTGLPAAAMIAGGEILRRAGRDTEGGFVTALGLALAGLFVSLEIRHWFNDGVITLQPFTLAESATQTLAALGFAIGLQRIATFSRMPVYRAASEIAGGVGAFIIVVSLLIFANPYVTDDGVGARTFFNLLLPAYLLTGLAAAFVALLSRPVRPRWYTLGYAALAGFLLVTFITLTVRHAWHGTYLGMYRPTSDGEFWTYSAAWLLTGAAVLALGLWLRSLPIRIASGLLIALTVCKVFVLDMSALSGFLRALSFIGLGLSLLAIGRFYQRVVLPSGNSEEGEPAHDG